MISAAAWSRRALLNHMMGACAALKNATAVSGFFRMVRLLTSKPITNSFAGCSLPDPRGSWKEILHANS